MKRLLSILLAVMLLSTMGIVAIAEEQETLVFWTLQQSDSDVQGAQERAVAAFEEENNCKVEVTAFPYNELRDKLLAALAGGEGPDILLMDQIWVGQYAAAGFVEPIDEQLAASGIKHEDFFEGAWGASTYLGQTYGVPFDVGVWAMLYYNKDMFREAGLDPELPPKTWDEFLEYGKKLTNGDKYGTAVWVGTGDSGVCMVDAFTFSAGGKIVEDDNSAALLNSEAGVKALNFWNDMVAISPPGAVGRGEEDSLKLFTSGQVAMCLYGEWGQDTIATRAPEMDYGVALLPVPEEDAVSIGTFGGWLTGINKKCENKELAWKFIEYTSQKEVNKQIVGLTPANIEAAGEFLQERRIYPDVILQQLTTALYRPSTPIYTQLSEVQRNAIERVILGDADAQTALDDAAAEINAMLAE